MKLLLIGIGALVVAVIGAAVTIRMLPVKIPDATLPEDRPAPADVKLPGGYHVVRAANKVDLEALKAQIMATARTKALSGAPDALPMVFLHRSAVWGFPDITQVWITDGAVHIHSHLVYGRSDLGVNEKRMRGWLAALGI